jgi:hypothetical protein
MEITPEIQALLDTQKTELTSAFEESVAGLKKSQQDLLAEKSDRQAAVDASEAKAEQARLDKARADKDVDTLTESFEGRLKAAQDENANLVNGIKQGKIKDIANSFVGEHIVDDAFSRQAMTSEYAKRIDIREGKPVVLDAGGNLTSLTVEDLNTEILASSIYAGHIKSTNASGGGTGGSRNNGGAGTTKQDFNGSLAEQTAATVAKVPALAELPLR